MTFDNHVELHASCDVHHNQRLIRACGTLYGCEDMSPHTLAQCRGANTSQRSIELGQAKRGLRLAGEWRFESSRCWMSDVEVVF